MADDITKKISIDIEVNTDGQQQINQYRAAFESLQNSIAGLGNTLTGLSKSTDTATKNLEKVAAVTEKSAAKIVSSSKQAAAQQASINEKSNKNLKESLSVADKLQQEAIEIVIKQKYAEYDTLATKENDEFAKRKKMTDDLLATGLTDKTTHSKEIENLTQQHYYNLRKIMDQYIADVKASEQELTATSIKNINITASKPQEVLSEKLALPKLEQQTSLFKGIVSIAKKAYSNIFSYYKDGTKASDNTAVDSAAKTQAKITDVTKTEEDKRRTSIIESTQKISDSVFTIITKGITAQSDYGVSVLEKAKNSELSDTTKTAAQQQAIKTKYAAQELALKTKAFKENQKVSIAQAVINGAIAITKAESDLGPIAGTIAIAAIVANTAAQITTIAKQQPPAMAKGGYFKSDGKGSILPGYSRTDDTNAYLRSGEAVVVSEAMQVPWARNLVSAINVGFGGRDFSMPGTSRGYAVGGIFTDGGDANRYYNQPVNDQKNLANTIAYQMINNFPPVYVDVKDVNNQQNILAQTINRVNL